MRFIKPSWVAHGDGKRQTIYSIHVHPDGSRIATGGLDAKIRIWSTKPILNQLSEASGKPPKSLCTLTMHTGPVLSVRWAQSGRWLASGSDDQIVMIWDLDPNAKGRVWGSDEVNVEGWKPLKRLPGHDSDVVDIAWSPSDRYLASVGLDSAVIIWCGFTLERLRRIEQHQGFVKGVCWDPVGEFLATQSDDKTVKIWRTSDWGLEADVTKPFEDSPTSTFFRRLSWSPDGAHITASNATNNRGFVFIAAVITRGTWASDISLVGHENAVQVASYNPHIFLRDPSQPVTTANICSVVALGADDNSVSIWQTKCARPLIVAKEVFDRQILDLSWSWDGLVLYAASSDGSIAAFQFDQGELDGIAPHVVQEQYLQKFNFSPTPVPTGYSHTIPSQSTTTATPTPSQPPVVGVSEFVETNGDGVHKLVAKRRKPATQASQVPSAAVNGSSSTGGGGGGPRRAVLVSGGQSQHKQQQQQQQQHPQQQQQRQQISPSSGFPTEAEQPFGDPGHHRASRMWGSTMMMDIDSSSSSIPNTTNDDEGTKPIKPRTLGGDRPRDRDNSAIVVPKILDHSPLPLVGWTNGATPGMMDLPVPSLQSLISVKVDGSDRTEGKNGEGEHAVYEVIYYSKNDLIFVDYLPLPILLLVASSRICAVALQDGTIVVWSCPFGRRLAQPLITGSPPSTMDVNEYALLVITSSGTLFSWNMKTSKAYFPPTSLSPILSTQQPNRQITSATIQSNGTPIIICSDACAFSYDSGLGCWVQVSDKWWGNGSEAWPGRQRNTTSTSGGGGGGGGVVSWIDNQISQSIPAELSHLSDSTPRPNFWTACLTLAHLETKIHTAELMGSREEYKSALMVYVRKIGDEGFKGMAEDLIKELFGPVYWKPDIKDTWAPTVVGLSKRDLLKDVLLIFAKSKTLKKLSTDWQDTLKRASAE